MAESVSIHVRKYRIRRRTWKHLAFSLLGPDEWRRHFSHPVIHFSLYYWIPYSRSRAISRSKTQMRREWSLHKIPQGLSWSRTRYGCSFGVCRIVL